MAKSPQFPLSLAQRENVSKYTRKMVPPARFQRATSRLGGERSMQLSYGSRLVNGKW